MAALIDEEVKALIDGAYARCKEILTGQRDALDFVADYLLQYETMDAAAFALVFTDRAAVQPPKAFQPAAQEGKEPRDELPH